MGRDIPLGRIAGIKVGANVSVLLVAALYTFILAHNNLPILQPGLSTTAYWVAGAAGAVLLFLSLLVHEIGHALVARDEGIGVHSMALTLLGGVTRMESSPTTAGSEFRVSVVGPIASGACGVALLCGAYALPAGGLPGLAGQVLRWAGILNVILAAFNILPATPLDGGRVLSSLIWKRTGSQATAMKATAAIGVAAGGGLVLWGLRNITGLDHHVYGWYGILLGGFILMSAIREFQAAPLYGLLDGVTVRQGMAAAPPTAASWSTVADFLRTSSPRPEHQAYPVVGPDGHVGALLTASSIRALSPDRWERTSVSDLAVPLGRIVRLAPTEPLLPAVQKVEMSASDSGVVIDAHGQVLGTIDASAVHRAMSQRRAGFAVADVG